MGFKLSIWLVLCIIWQRDFSDVVKLRVLIWGDYPEISRWVLNAIKCILIGGRQRDLTHIEEEKTMGPKREIGVM